MISGGPASFPASSPTQRRTGFLRTLGEAGVRFDPAHERVGDFSALGGYEAMQALLALPDAPTAVFAMSDEMAMGAMRACVEAGLSIPDDMSIVGFDDVDWAFAVGLSTVRQDATELGAVAARLMIERLEGESAIADCDVRRLITIPTELVVRDSTGPPVSN